MKVLPGQPEAIGGEAGNVIQHWKAWEMCSIFNSLASWVNNI